MSTPQGDLSLLEEPAVQDLLKSAHPARLAYNWLDGTPRVVPIWFHWDGKSIILGGPTGAPKIKALTKNPQVALTIDSIEWPYAALLLRGTTVIDVVEGVSSEYAASAERYFGPEQGQAWVNQLRSMSSEMARVTVTPTWVGFIDFQTRFPSALGI